MELIPLIGVTKDAYLVQRLSRAHLGGTRNSESSGSGPTNCMRPEPSSGMIWSPLEHRAHPDKRGTLEAPRFDLTSDYNRVNCTLPFRARCARNHPQHEIVGNAGACMQIAPGSSSQNSRLLAMNEVRLTRQALPIGNPQDTSWSAHKAKCPIQGGTRNDRSQQWLLADR